MYDFLIKKETIFSESDLTFLLDNKMYESALILCERIKCKSEHVSIILKQVFTDEANTSNMNKNSRYNLSGIDIDVLLALIKYGAKVNIEHIKDVVEYNTNIRDILLEKIDLKCTCDSSSGECEHNTPQNILENQQNEKDLKTAFFKGGLTQNEKDMKKLIECFNGGGIITQNDRDMKKLIECFNGNRK